MDAFRRAFTGEIVALDPITADESSFEQNIAYIARRAPDLVFVAGTNISALALLREARRQHLRADFLGGDGWTGVVSDTAVSEGVYIGAPFSPDDAREDVRRFVAAFRAKYGVVPDGNAALAYDATRLVLRAVERGGATREGVRDWLAAIDASAPYPGVTGAIRFRESGDVVGKGFVMTRAERGALHVLARSAQ
jgi:branched-chain amino acid transport system substrate-binding protein